jgi:hypothetical protein
MVNLIVGLIPFLGIVIVGVGLYQMTRPEEPLPRNVIPFPIERTRDGQARKQPILPDANKG